MTRLTQFSLANRKLILFLTLIVAGLAVYVTPGLNKQVLPNLELPILSVVATYPGASPEVVEEQVTIQLEGALSNLEGLTSTTATTRPGSSAVLLQYDFDTDIADQTRVVQQQLSRVARLLPSEVTTDVITGSTSEIPAMTLAVTSDHDLQELGRRVQTRIVPELQGIDGVNDVTTSGTRSQEIAVSPDPEAMVRAGTTADILASTLADVGTVTPAGALDAGGKAMSIAVGGASADVANIRDLWLAPVAPGTAPVQVKDVATVELRQVESTSITRTDGRDSLGIAITMTRDGSASAISDDVHDLIPGLQESMSNGTTITVVSDDGPIVNHSISGLLEEGLLGMAMAILVILLFLRSGRSTLVTAISIPLSLLIALIVLWARDYSLNLFTLGALTMAIGRVVDDSIVVLENIKRHLGYGEGRMTAIVDAVREVSAAVVSSTLTTVAVFLPVALVGGFVGELFAPFAVTVAAAMLASLAVALVVIPVLAYWFLPTAETHGTSAEEHRRAVEAEEREGFSQRTYHRVITWSLGHRKSVLAGSAALLVGTLALMTGLNTSFLGDQQTESLRISQTLPAGTNLTATNAAAEKAERVIASTDGVESYQVALGSATGGFSQTSGANSATFTVALADPDNADQVENRLRDGLGDLASIDTSTGEFTFEAAGGVTAETIELVLSADDPDVLEDATAQVQDVVEDVDEVTDVTSNLADLAPQVVIDLRGEEAATAGVTEAQVAAAINSAVAGSSVAQTVVDGQTVDIVIQTTDQPASLKDLTQVSVPTAVGPVRVEDVAELRETGQPVELHRTDGVPTTTLTASPVGDDTGSATSAVDDAVRDLDLPAGVEYSIGGVAADQDEAFIQLGLAMLIAIALVFLILIGVFHSIRQTLILLVSVPFAFTGAFALLFITSAPIGVAALIGMLMLIGIVVTNAIVLMDLINQYRARGLTVVDAVVEGGLRRLRPILMTAAATMLALVPMALGITGAGGFISQPLGVVVIGGLFTSTLLTLVLIPVLYTIVESRRERSEARRAKQRELRAQGSSAVQSEVRDTTTAR
jgi:multidrug efflux pump subunit AcrB